jgi:predicted cupin superfamily sugar epimerase/uncharacterized protein (DUF952 family)
MHGRAHCRRMTPDTDIDTDLDTAVFHICSRTAIEAARREGEYRAESLTAEGFIHLSRAAQVLPTARAYFRDVPDLVVLVIDPTLLSARLVYEPPAPLPGAHADASAPSRVAELFPHCYGPIALTAIVDVVDLAHFRGDPIHADTMAMLRHFRFERLPVEGTLYHSSWRSAAENTHGEPAGTAMIGLYADSPESVSCFHRLTHDEVWHAYAGDPFSLFLLHPDGRTETVLMGTDPIAGQRVQYVVPAGVWQAGCLVAGGRFALFGCTMAPGFTGGCFEAGAATDLLAQYPSAAQQIARLAIHDGIVRMPTGFAS